MILTIEADEEVLLKVINFFPNLVILKRHHACKILRMKVILDNMGDSEIRTEHLFRRLKKMHVYNECRKTFIRDLEILEDRRILNRNFVSGGKYGSESVVKMMKHS